MMLESLLKNINQIIKRNSKFFEDNPELYKAVEERFSKAAYDDDEEDYGGYGTEFEDPNYDQQDEEDYGADYDLFDQGTDESEAQDEDPDAGYARETSGEDESQPVDLMEDEGDAAQNEAIKQWMAQQKAKKQQAAPQQPVADKKPSMNDVQAEIARIRSQKQAEPQKEPAQTIAEEEENRYKDQEPGLGDKSDKVIKKPEWAMDPNKYSPQHLKDMMSFMHQGFSGREAEALAGAHEQLPSVDHILRRNMKPNDPSPQMINMLRQHLQSHHGRLTHERNLKLDPAENPDLHFNANKTHMVNNAMGSKLQAMATEHKRLLDQGLSEDDIADMMPAFEHKWEQENPHHAQGMSQAIQNASNLHTTSKEARSQRREEVKNALVIAGKGISGGEDATSSIVGDTSQIQAGKGMAEAIRQGAGGVKGEGDEASTQMGMAVDPHSVMATAPKNKAFMQKLEQEQAGKAVAKLTPEQIKTFSPEMQARLKNIDGIKKREQ